MEITAAIAREAGQPFSIERVELDSPRPDEVVVQLVATGICHTDVVVRDQWFPVPLPVVLGHEGAGVVAAVGSAVTTVQPGDHVVMSMLSCRHCDNCRTSPPGYCVAHYDLNFGGRRADGSATLHQGTAPINGHFFAQSSFATHALASQHNVVKVRDDVALELLGPLGCGIQTGAGAIINSLAVRPGTSVAVFGTGAVGLSAVMAAALSGATTIIGVDVHRNRLELATELGATHTVDASTDDPLGAIADITAGRGVDYSVETSAVPAVARQAVECLALLGVCGLVGVPPTGTALTLDFQNVLFGRAVKGIIGGDARAHLFIPTLIDLWAAGSFPFDRLIQRYPFADINVAVDDALDGSAIKPVLVMPG